MLKNFSRWLLAFSLAVPCYAASEPLHSKSDDIWEALKIFEGDFNKVSGDFDCQGMSIGTGQWNIGKSKDAVSKIIASIPKEQLASTMPVFGQRLVQALAAPKEDALKFVQSLQTYANSVTCDAKTRRAQWTDEGKIFVRELSRALATESSRKTQRRLQQGIFKVALQDATRWADSARGPGAMPTNREIAYFLDMRIFHGRGLSNFGFASQPLSAEVRLSCASETLRYLKEANDDFLLHKKAARRNAEYLKPDSLEQGDRDLFCLSHMVAKKLNAEAARQFRLTTINRRSAILFGSAYYSDEDKTPTKIRFSSDR